MTAGAQISQRFSPSTITLSLSLILILSIVNITHSQNATLPPPLIQDSPDLTIKFIIPNNYRLLPEGFKISGRTAKLIKLPDQPSWFLAWEEALNYDTTKTNNISSTPDAPTNPDLELQNTSYTIAADPFARPIEVHPCHWLNTMLKEVGNRVDMSVDFRVWGEITTYHNRNYILPTMVAQPPLFTDIPQIKTLPTTSLNTMLTEQKTEAPSTAQTTDKSILPENLRLALLALRHIKDQYESNYKMPASPANLTLNINQRQTQVITSNVSNWKEGQMILNRLGRIRYEPDSGIWIFSFEADTQSLAEPPVVLHPNQLLEVMEEIDHLSVTMAKFRVSGQIYKYQERNYMLIRMVMRVYDSKNLGK